MTLRDIEKKVVEDNNWLTKKQLYRVCSKWGLMMLFSGLSFGYLTLCILGFILALLSMLGFLAIYFWVLDASSEDELGMRKLSKISNFWFLGVLFFIIVIVVMKLLNFA